MEYVRAKAVGDTFPGRRLGLNLMRRTILRAARMALSPFGLELHSRSAPRRSSLAPELDIEALRNCRVLPSREHWLQTLPRESIGAEIGVFRGDFSDAILRLAQPQVLFLIDLWGSAETGDAYDGVVARFAQEISAGSVRIMRGHSIDVLSRMPDKSLDWAYIDTTHAYELTRDELLQCERLVRDNGIIAGHDYCEGNSVRGLAYGVIQAVHEFCINRGWAFDGLALAPNGHWTFSLRKVLPSAN